MDERTVAGLLHEAADEVPEADFDERDIARRSGALARRRRVRGVGTLAGVMVVCAGVALGLGFGHTGSSRTAGGQASAASAERAPVAGSARALPVAPSLQGDGATGTVGPRTGCRRADGELAAALASELPSAASPRTPPFDCPPGSRFAGYATGGTVAGALLVPGPPPAGPLAGEPSGASTVTVRTARGATLYLVSEPLGRSAPRPPGELTALAKSLAAKF